MQTDVERVFAVNIICNNCVGARIYEKKEKEFSNPFVWCIIPPKDFITLINEYDNINFQNIEIKNNTILIDNKINVFYVHYKKGNYKTPTKIGTDIYVNDVEKYTKEKYLKRLKRMSAKNDPTVFIISDKQYGDDKYTFKDFSLLDDVNTCYNCVLITDKKDIKKKGINTIYVKDSKVATGTLADVVIKELKL